MRRKSTWLACLVIALTMFASSHGSVGAAAHSTISTPAPSAQLTFDMPPDHALDLGAWLYPRPTKACQRLPDDYRKTSISGKVINVRTLWMLRLANYLYTGPGNPLRVVQGSYTDDLDASFGTHAGGGVVDISIRTKLPPHDVVSMDEAKRLVLALRNAGFAAWLRLPDDLDPPTTLHIHAVAVGDRELSEAAYQQVRGPDGYFAGYDGVPPEHGGPKLDRYGGPVICQWMHEDGLLEAGDNQWR